MVEKILLFGEINKEKAEEVCSRLFEAEGEEVDLIINSPGGAFDDALAIVACMNLYNLSGGEVNTIGLGEVSSSALMILACGKRKREIGRNVFSITHQIYTEGNISGFSHELRDEADIIEQMNGTYLDVLLKNTGKTVAEIKDNILVPKDTRIKPDLLLSLNMVDKIIYEF